MGSDWRPDDSFIDKEGGELKGVLRVKEALKKHGIEARPVVTSRDEGIDKVRQELKRTHLPPGFEQWQLPVALGPNQDAVAFVTVGLPGAEIPEHSHKCDLFRIVVSGSVYHEDKELTAGDWMYVKEGAPYKLTAGGFGCIIFHMYW
jgi:quercetin dioxygenase-like cupin family protein